MKVQTGAVMRHIFYLLTSVIVFVCSSIQAQSRPASDWQMFRVPDYGTQLEYPASIFSAVGPSEPIRKDWIHDEAFAASRLSMMRIMARRMKAATVVA